MVLVERTADRQQLQVNLIEAVCEEYRQPAELTAGATIEKSCWKTVAQEARGSAIHPLWLQVMQRGDIQDRLGQRNWQRLRGHQSFARNQANKVDVFG